MEPNTWRGEKVRLRAVEPGDWEVLHASNVDTEAARHSYQIPFPRSAERMKTWAEELALAEPENDVFRWVIENRAGEVVGTINTHSCDRRCGTFQYGLTIFGAYRRKGYASEAIKLLLTYFFLELRYQKVTVNIYSFNQPSLKLQEKLGFQEEGRLRRMVYTDGAYHDVLVFGLTREEFEELHVERGQ